jgi:hypothetical protein
MFRDPECVWISQLFSDRLPVENVERGVVKRSAFCLKFVAT